MSKQLSILKKSLGKIVLKNEVLLLNKWMYKNKNQHRRADYFHKLRARHWRKFIEIKLSEWIKDYTDHPSYESLKDGCFKMFHAYALLQKTQSEIMLAYAAFRRQVELTYFMSISLFAMGILARLHYLIQDLLDKIQDAYYKLKDSSFKLPNVLSLQEFITWTLKDQKKDELEDQKIQSDSSSEEDDNRSGSTQDKSLLSEEFWTKSTSGPKPTISVKAKQKPDPKKKRKLVTDDVDKIFGLLD